MNVVHGYDAATKGGDLGRRVTASYWGSSGRRVQILSARPSAAGFGEPGSCTRYRLFPARLGSCPQPQRRRQRLATDLDTEHGGTDANKRDGARQLGRLNVDDLQR
jgi:hypothetical protein